MTSSENNITSFFIYRPECFKQLISSYYPLNNTQIKKYKLFFDNHLLLNNTSIQWNSDILNLFKSEEDWQIISKNSSVFKNILLLDEFYDMIHWKDPHQSLFSTLANNKGLPWSYELIEKYKNSWDYYQMSYNDDIPWSEKLIDEHIEEWDWAAMALNEGLPWSVPFLKKHIHRIENYNFFFRNNQSITGNFEVVQEYGHILDWSAICANRKLPWCEKNLIELWKDRIDWDIVSKENILSCRVGYTAKNMEKYLSNDSDFESISHNQKMPWSISLIERFIDKWDWEALSTNLHLPWSKELIDYFKDYIFWGKIKIEKVEHDEDGNFLDYDTFQTWKNYGESGIESNEAVPWSLDLILQFEKKLELEMLFQNKSVWERAFKPYVNDKLIDTVIRII